ncbi:MAG: protein kinase [Pleurocapsa sp.]
MGYKHPQIPNLYAFFTPIVPNTRRTGDEQYFYLAQEFIDGQDLEAELEAKGKFSEVEVTEILTEILKILQFVHDNNNIHRDIKPSNIMRNKDGLLYLLDFGAVKQVAVGGGNNKKSTGVYSMGFAPPEQMSGSQVYPSTDIYALAVTCITLLTGKPAEDLYDSFNNRWTWHSFAPQISDRLTKILDKMLLPTPANRFQSAADALTALTVKKSPPAVSNQSNLPKNLPAPSTPAPGIPAPSISKPNTPGLVKRNQPSFSLTEVLGSAAFVGFEGSLLYIGLPSLLSLSGVSLGILGMVMGGIVFALSRRIIEKADLIIFAGITAVIVAFVPALHSSLVVPSIFMIAAISGAGAIAITAFFRLVYQLLSRFL